MNLYEITSEMQAALDAVQVNDDTGEVTGFEDVDALNMEFEDKADATACYIKSLLVEAEAIKHEASTLKERADAKVKKADRLKSYIESNMIRVGIPKIETARNVLAMRKTPPSIVIDDAELFATWARHNNEDLLTYADPKPNKKEIKSLLDSGEAVPFVHVEQRETLRIK